MPRDFKAAENTKRARAKRAAALARTEFRYPSDPRTAPAGATSFPIKAEDPENRRLIDKALARRKEPT